MHYQLAFNCEHRGHNIISLHSFEAINMAIRKTNAKDNHALHNAGARNRSFLSLLFCDKRPGGIEHDYCSTINVLGLSTDSVLHLLP